MNAFTVIFNNMNLVFGITISLLVKIISVETTQNWESEMAATSTVILKFVIYQRVKLPYPPCVLWCTCLIPCEVNLLHNTLPKTQGGTVAINT